MILANNKKGTIDSATTVHAKNVIHIKKATSLCSPPPQSTSFLGPEYLHSINRRSQKYQIYGIVQIMDEMKEILFCSIVSPK